MRTARLQAESPTLRPKRARELSGPERLIFEASPAATAVAWNDGGDLLINAAGRALIGLGPLDRVRSVADLQALLGLKEDDCTFLRAMRGEATPVTEPRVTLPCGERVWSVETTPIFDEDGEPMGAVAIARDVTDEALEAEMADELLGRAAHDLRTPLTALKASAQLVARGLERLDASARSRTFQLMLAQVEKLASRIDEVVDAARIRRGRWDFSLAELDLSTTLRTIVDELEHAGTPTIALNAPASVKASVDPLRLRQIFARLGAEALDHDDHLSIDLTVRGDSAVIAVETDERPIPRTTRQLARSIVTRWGGRIEEPAPGRLVFAFPLSEAPKG